MAPTLSDIRDQQGNQSRRVDRSRFDYDDHNRPEITGLHESGGLSIGQPDLECDEGLLNVD